MANGLAMTDAGLLINREGMVDCIVPREARSHQATPETKTIVLRGKALLPGLANAHSHTFQRLFRGRAEGRAVGGDTFWTWREQMYKAAAFVSPEELYDVARATFLEMACAGITVVGEFHYLHGDPEGRPYADPNLLSKQVIAAAQSVGIRICLLRSAYFRAGFERPPHPGQRRFYEDPKQYLLNLAELAAQYADNPAVTIGTAPHSVRAVPIAELKAIADLARVQDRMPLHIHVSEQVAENEACCAEYGETPVNLLHNNGILSPRTTLIHAIHLTEQEFTAVSATGATICSCPSTERNLGDGIFPADRAAAYGIPVAFGTDSQAQIDILEDARMLEYHLRLRDQQRGILDSIHGSRVEVPTIYRAEDPIADYLYRSASRNGYASLGLKGGSLRAGEPADFFTIDLDDLSILGVDPRSLASQAVFALAKGAIRDVVVAGHTVLKDGQHADQEVIRSRFKDVQKRYVS